MNTEVEVIETAKIGEAIPPELAEKMVKDHQDAYGSDDRGFIIGFDILEAIKAQPDCKGIYFMPAINEKGEKTFVYVGLNSKGKMILEVPKEENGIIRMVPAIVADRNGEPDPDFIKELDEHGLNWWWLNA